MPNAVPLNLDYFPRRLMVPPAPDNQSNGHDPVGPIYPEFTIREDHVNDVIITEHPVEQGAAITDHAYSAPAGVTVRYGWTNASAAAAGNPHYVTEFYKKLKLLQASCEPLIVVTGKDVYKDMLIASLRTHTDDETATTLFAEVRFQQIIIVSTLLTSVGSASNMANPASTAATVNLGGQQLGPAPNFNASAADAST